jgi:uncharacterized protein (TIGR02246 family)
MAVRQPEDMHRAFTTAFNAGDLDALMALYEPGASLAPAPGQTVSGVDAIRIALAAFLALRGRMTITTLRIVPAGDLALLHGSWTLVGTDPDGKAVELTGRDAEVVRRQDDGGWRFIIDNPFGDA